MKNKFLARVLVVAFAITTVFGSFAPASVSAEIPKTGENLLIQGGPGSGGTVIGSFKEADSWQFNGNGGNCGIIQDSEENGTSQDGDGYFISFIGDQWGDRGASYKMYNAHSSLLNQTETSYVVTFWYRGDGAKLRAYAQVDGWDSSDIKGQVLSDDSIGSLSSENPDEWKYAEFEYNSSVANGMNVHIRFQAEKASTSTIYIDNVQVYLKGESEATEEPVVEPTDEPIVVPTEEPTDEPIVVPTEEPTDEPIVAPTEEPTDEPVVTPTDEPTVAPTDAPTDVPTSAPTDAPIVAPTDAPAGQPTVVPTVEPTKEPTASTDNAFKKKKAKLVSVKKSGKKVKIKVKKVAGATGYQISQSPKKKGTKIVSTFKAKKALTKVIKAKKGKKLYYKVRAYKKVGKTKVYTAWTKVKAFKLK